ncbi:MAG: hypothetical protein ACMUIL_02255 [bacterium]
MTYCQGYGSLPYPFVDDTLSVPGAAGSGSLTISMWKYYDTNHLVDVSVNDAPVGTFSWSGRDWDIHSGI